MDITSKKLIEYKTKQGIYMFTIGSHTYIGSSINLYARLMFHRQRLKSGKHHNSFMLNCWKKYQECKVEILEVCDVDKKELLQREKDWIDIFQPDLNLEPDPTTQQNCKTTSKKVYQYDMDGNFIQEHESASSAERFLGKCNSKISQCCLGKRKSTYGYLWSYNKVDTLIYKNNSSKAKAKKVSQYSTAGKFIKTYKSVAEAVRTLNKPQNACTNISNAALGHTNQAYGYVWKYE